MTTVCSGVLLFLDADTSFMYMIAGLCMLKLYQKRHPDINASAYTAYACLAAVIFFSVLGVVRSHTDHMIAGFLGDVITHAKVHVNILLKSVDDVVFAGIWERKHSVLDRFLGHSHSGHTPPQHTALLHGPMEAG